MSLPQTTHAPASTRPLSTEEIAAIRRDFPILNEQVRGQPLVYLDNAATSQKPHCVIQAVEQFYRHSNANVHRGVHYLSEKATILHEQARKTAQQFIQAASEREVIFTRGATESINLVAQSFARPRLQPGDEILISEMEHHSNIIPWQLVCEQTGAQLKVLPFNDAGELCLEQLPGLLTEKTKLVAIVHLSNSLGTINPIKQIIKQAHAQDIPVLIDGAQAAAHLPIDVKALDCDFYALSAHKMFGPTGIGLLYGKEKWLAEMPPYQGGGEMIKSVTFEKSEYHDLPYKFEAGTQNLAGAIGMAAAIDYLNQLPQSRVMAYEQQLLTYATEQALAFEDLIVIGTAKNKAGILSFIHKKIHAHDLGTIVDQYGVAIRTGHHCTMPVMQHYRVPATSRASFAFYNTFEEIDKLFDALTKANEVFG